MSHDHDVPLGPPPPGPSDVRLKTDVTQVGTTVLGLPLYLQRTAVQGDKAILDHFLTH